MLMALSPQKSVFLYHLVFAHAIALETKFKYTGIESQSFNITQTTLNVYYQRSLTQGH